MSKIKPMPVKANVMQMIFDRQSETSLPSGTNFVQV